MGKETSIFSGRKSQRKLNRKYGNFVYTNPSNHDDRHTFNENLLEIFVDNFAGGGGASTGIEKAIGRSVDAAINHDPAAIAMHTANHPETKHYCESVWDVDPREVAAGRQVGLVWLSPDCKHFSKAKGGKPVEKGIRGLAWVTIRWAATVRPRVIMLENVEEFKTWGPVIPLTYKNTGRIIKIDDTLAERGEIVPPEEMKMMPDPKQKGRTFKSFINALKRHGYEVEWRELKACDYGAPTIRKRFFLVARCDGKPIVWPKPTHGAPDSPGVVSGELLPWKPAADIIDWSIPCPSIFTRKRELADNTKRRIAKGLMKFVINSADPYVVNSNIKKNGAKGKQPGAKKRSALETSFISRIGQTKFGGDRMQYSIEDPLTTIVTKAEHLLVTAFLAQYHTETAGHEVRGQALEQPLLTQDTSNRFAIVTSYLVKMRGTNIGQPVTEPLHTVTAGGLHHAEVRAFLIAYYGSSVGQSLNDPLGTVTTHERFGLVTIHGTLYQIVDIGMRMLEPHELFGAQGFPTNYIIDRYSNGEAVPKSAQVARCGNSVSPVIPDALVRANLPEYCTGTGNVLRFERYKETEGQLQLSM